MQLQTLTCLRVKRRATERYLLHQSLDASSTLTCMCACALMHVPYLCACICGHKYVCLFLFCIGAECTASWEEGCFVQEWAIYSWLFPQQQIIGCSTVIQTTTCIRGCGDTACLENASHTQTALVRFPILQGLQCLQNRRAPDNWTFIFPHLQLAKWKCKLFMDINICKNHKRHIWMCVLCIIC